MPGVVWQHYYLLMENDIHARMGFANFHMWTSHEMYICETFLKCPRTSTSSVSIILDITRIHAWTLNDVSSVWALKSPTVYFLKEKKSLALEGFEPQSIAWKSSALPTRA
jgi:hypothetical protein